jgi:hypothetical protein
MSGKLLVKAIARERGRTFSDAVLEQLEAQYSDLFHDIAPSSPRLQVQENCSRSYTNAMSRTELPRRASARKSKGL